MLNLRYDARFTLDQPHKQNGYRAENNVVTHQQTSIPPESGDWSKATSLSLAKLRPSDYKYFNIPDDISQLLHSKRAQIIWRVIGNIGRQ